MRPCKLVRRCSARGRERRILHGKDCRRRSRARESKVRRAGASRPAGWRRFSLRLQIGVTVLAAGERSRWPFLAWSPEHLDGPGNRRGVFSFGDGFAVVSKLVARGTRTVICAVGLVAVVRSWSLLPGYIAAEDRPSGPVTR